MKNTLVTILPNGVYQNADLDNEVQVRHGRNMNDAYMLGTTSAIRNVIQHDTPLHVVTEPIRSAYDSLNSDAHRLNEGTLSIAQGKLQITELEIENERLAPAITQLQGTIEITEKKMGEVIVPSIPFRLLITALVIGSLVMLTDAYYLGTSLQVTGSGFLVSLCLGLGISLSITIISAFITEAVSKYQNRWIRVGIVAGLGLLVGASVYALCEMREEYYQAQNGHSVGAARLALLSTLAFVAIHFLYKYLVSPALERMKKRREVLDKLKKVKEMRAELSKMVQKYRQNEKSITDIKTFRLSALAYAISTEQSICRKYLEGLGAFKKSFIEQAGFVPKCFIEEPLPLTCYYSDITMTPTIHEKSV